VGAPRLVTRITNPLQSAIHTFRFPGDADLPAMVNQFVGKGNPPVLRDNFHEVLFHLFGRGVGGEFQAAGEAEDMGVDDHADGNTVSDAEDDVGGFAGRAGDGEKIFHLLRNFAVEVGNDLPRRTLNRLRLVVVEASGADDLFDLLNWRGGEVLCGGEGLEEDRSDHVDASVGALRRKDRGDEQFPGIAVMESTFDVWVSLPEEIEERGGFCGRRWMAWRRIWPVLFS